MWLQTIHLIRALDSNSLESERWVLKKSVCVQFWFQLQSQQLQSSIINYQEQWPVRRGSNPWSVVDDGQVSPEHHERSSSLHADHLPPQESQQGESDQCLATQRNFSTTLDGDTSGASGRLFPTSSSRFSGSWTGMSISLDSTRHLASAEGLKSHEVLVRQKVFSGEKERRLDKAKKLLE